MSVKLMKTTLMKLASVERTLSATTQMAATTANVLMAPDPQGLRYSQEDQAQPAKVDFTESMMSEISI